MKDLNKKRLITSLGIFIFVFTFSIIGLSEVQALEFKPQVGIPGSIFENTVSMEGNNSGTSLIAEFVKAIYNYGVSIGAILAAIMLMAGGLIWLTSGGSQEKVSQAKDIIFGSVIGLFILMGAYTILNMVNPNLVNLQTRVIDTINKETSNYGCCQTSTTTHEFGGNNITTKAQLTTKKLCESMSGKYKGENYIPNTYSLTLQNKTFYPGSVCVVSGCCKTLVGGVNLSGGVTVISSSFPSSERNCPTTDIKYRLANKKISFVEEKCAYSNTKNCANLENGSQCWDDGYMFTNCWEQVSCGFCYYDSCHITLGKAGEVCGGVGSIGTCKSACSSSEEETISGRWCETGLKCCFQNTQVSL